MINVLYLKVKTKIIFFYINFEYNNLFSSNILGLNHFYCFNSHNYGTKNNSHGSSNVKNNFFKCRTTNHLLQRYVTQWFPHNTVLTISTPIKINDRVICIILDSSWSCKIFTRLYQWWTVQVRRSGYETGWERS